MTDVQDISVSALIRLPRYMKDWEVEIGGPRLITVSRGFSEVSQPPEAVTRTSSKLFLYQRPSDMGPEEWLVFVFDPVNKQAGNDAAEDVSQYEGEHILEPVGEISMGILWSPSKKLSMLCADMSKEFMKDAALPHYLLLPKMMPAALRISKYYQLWVSL